MWSLSNFEMYLKKIADFYSTPVIKFSYSTICYIIYLLYFTVMLLTRLQVTSISIDIPFIILILWTFTLSFEEIRQASSLGISFKSYLSNIWNKLDMLANFFFMIATICYILSQLDYFANALIFFLIDVKPIGAIRENILRFSRFSYGISIFFFIFRIMQVFSINSNLGPKIVMIQSMIEKDLGPSITILLVFIMSYAITMWTIAFKIEDSRTIRDLPVIIFLMFRTSFFQILGDNGVDILMENTSCSTNNFMCDDPWGKWCSPIILAIYLVLSNVLILNLIVAMFSNTYEIIQSSSNQYWTLQRYQLYNEYSNRPPIPPPFVIFWQIYYYISICYNGKKKLNIFKKSYENSLIKEKQLIQWERMRTSDYLRSLDQNNSNRNTSKVIVVNQGNNIGGSFSSLKKDLVSMNESINEKFNERICNLENRLLRLDIIEINLEEIKGLIDQLTTSNEMNKHMITNYFQEKEEFKISYFNETNLSQDRESNVIEDVTNLLVYTINDHFIARLSPISNNKADEIIIKVCNETLDYNPWSSKMLYQHYIAPPINNYAAHEKFGRETLPLLGINKCIHLIISRLNKYESTVDSKLKPKLEIVTIQQNKNILEIPFFLIEHSDVCIVQSCIPNILNGILKNDFVRCKYDTKQNNSMLDEHDLLSLQTAVISEIFRGYIQDVRNTDNSWMETIAFNIHQTNDLSFSDKYLKIFEHDQLETACWIDSNDEAWSNPANIFLINTLKKYLN